VAGFPRRRVHRIFLFASDVHANLHIASLRNRAGAEFNRTYLLSPGFCVLSAALDAENTYFVAGVIVTRFQATLANLPARIQSLMGTLIQVTWRVVEAYAQQRGCCYGMGLE
jgi:hypothetical protein